MPTMRKSPILLITFMFTICTVLGDVAKAQLVINKSNIEDLFSKKIEIESSVSSDTDNIVPLMSIKGADQSWDFSNLIFTDSLSSSGEIEISSEIAGAPLSDDPHFSQATHVFTSNIETDTLSFSSYSYQQLTDTALVSLGSVFLLEGENDASTVLYNRPGNIDLILPASFSDTWQYVNESEIQFGGNTQTSESSVTSEIDGWGTLITSNGEFEVLRITQEEVTTTAGIEFKSIEIKFINSSGAEIAIISAEEIEFVGIDEESVQATVNTLSESVATSNEPLSKIPEEFILEQNYPNPFNPSTTISFSIPQASSVKIQVYNMLGKKVGTMLNRNLTAGRHQVSFDASALSSGIYLYQIKAGNYQQTRKMTLIK